MFVSAYTYPVSISSYKRLSRACVYSVVARVKSSQGAQY